MYITLNCFCLTDIVWLSLVTIQCICKYVALAFLQSSREANGLPSLRNDIYKYVAQAFLQSVREANSLPSLGNVLHSDHRVYYGELPLVSVSC
jgi:hypothetical protein